MALQKFTLTLIVTFASIFPVYAFPLASKPLPEEALKVMQKKRYEHSTWGIHVKDSVSNATLFDLNSNQMFLPASTTKLFTTAALLHAYGDDYRFKTPIYALGELKEETFTGNLVLVAQGDLTFGGRQEGADILTYTKMDHTLANEIPGVILTKQSPLQAVDGLAKQISERGIKTVNGDVLIDSRLFEPQTKRGALISPIMMNENLIDIVINPSKVGQEAELSWRPQVKGYTVSNQLKTVSAEGKLEIVITADSAGRNIVVKGSVPMGNKDLVRTFPIKDPAFFTRLALIQALEAQGVTVNVPSKKGSLPPQKALKDLQPIAVWVSPPLSEYVKLILKVSHNPGANLSVMLLAVRNGQKTFNDGIISLGKFVSEEVHIAKNEFVFIDGAGGDNNRLTPHAEIQLLDYMKAKPQAQFQKYLDALPILGVDGSLEDFSKNTPAAGKVYAKPGTGVVFNGATQELFLTTQALTGFIKGKNGHLWEYMVVVNNAQLPTVEDVFSVFADLGEISATFYDLTE